MLTCYAMVNSLLSLLLSLSFAQTFESPCHFAGEDDLLQSTVQIEGTQWTQTHKAFTDESCQQTYLIFEIKSLAKIFQTKISHSKSSTAQTFLKTPLDLQIQEVAYTSTLDSVTRALNEIAFCNHRDWQTQVRQIVTGEQCQDYAAPKKGQWIFTLLEITENEKVLRLGVSSPQKDGTSSDKRHIHFDPLAYRRK